MRAYWLLATVMMALFLALFGLVEALEVPFLTGDPVPWLSSTGRLAAAATGFALLLVDVLLPVPASLVMIGNGVIFGIGLGTLLSLVGGVAASLVGFGLGRWGGPVLDRFVEEVEQKRADAFLARWGDLAVVVSRPIPILAETVAILAGTSNLGWIRFALASFAGNLPAAYLYAWTGATATDFDSIALMFGLVLLIAGGFWYVGQMIHRRAASSD